MKRKILNGGGKIILRSLVHLYPYWIQNKITEIKNKIYNIWIKKEFKQVGDGTGIAPLAELIGAKSITIGCNCGIQKGCHLTVWKTSDFQPNDIICEDPELIIGNDVKLGCYNHVTVANRITIKDGVLTGKWVTISDNNHGDYTENGYNEWRNLPPSERKLTSKGEIVICRNVWIGEKATILSGVTIGESAIVAANSVVTKDVPPLTIVAGSPAKVINKIS